MTFHSSPSSSPRAEDGLAARGRGWMRTLFQGTPLALLTMLAVLFLANAWVAARLPALMQESSLDALFELDRRVERFPHKEAVRVLIIGNSHVIAGMRPPVLAEALGVSPDAIFNLALPAASPREMRMLVERYAPRFPGARVAYCGVDGYFLGTTMDARLRYLTRNSVQERWAYALSRPELEDKLSLIAGQPVPIVDFSVQLKEAVFRDPPQFLKRLLQDEPPAATTQHARLATAPYRWGYPPPWDLNTPEENQVLALEKLPQSLSNRAWHLLANHALIPAGLAELGRMATHLEQRGIEVRLVELPVSEQLMDAMLERREQYQSYRRQLAAFVAESGRPYLAATDPLPTDYFYDGDHLNANGARYMAVWLKRRLSSLSKIEEKERAR